MEIELKRFFVISIFFIFVVCGYEGNSNVHEDVSVQKKSYERKEKKKPVLLTGERDEFHPKSQIESARKTRLTKFGILKNPPSILTPDKLSAEKAINKQEFMGMYVDIFDIKNLVIPSYPFDYENNIHALKRLYNSHHLDEVVNDGMSELQMLKALMAHTFRFMDGGQKPTSDTDIGPSAEIITKLRRERGIGGTSKHYSALFCQLALSCGFNARIISMHTIDDNGEVLTHDVCEVFLNSFDKWAVFDAYQRATYYVRDDIPQSALELREIMLIKNYRILHVFSEIGDFSDVISVKEKLLPRYKYIYMWRMNDILGRSPEGGTIPWQALYHAHLVWEDEYAPVAEGGFDKLEKFNNMANPDYPLNGVRYVTHSKSDFYWPLNHVTINIERTGEEVYFVHFDTVTPNFESFEIVDGSIIRQSNHTHKLKYIHSQFNVRSVNMFGMLGPSSVMSLSPRIQ